MAHIDMPLVALAFFERLIRLDRYWMRRTPLTDEEILALVYFFFLLGMQPIENTLVSRLTPPRWRHSAYGMKFILTFGVGALAVKGGPGHREHRRSNLGLSGAGLRFHHPGDDHRRIDRAPAADAQARRFGCRPAMAPGPCAPSNP